MFSAIRALNPKRSSSARQRQTTIGGDARTLEIHFETGVKRGLKRLILFLTRKVRFALKTL
jgi:hypothetical protein